MALSHPNGWRAVEAVLRTGSVAGAAEDLGVTPAAVGAQIRGLEARLGRQLFHRRPGGLAPVAELAALADRLAAALSSLAAVERMLSARAPDDFVAVTVTQTFAETWLPRHLPDLFARMGRLDLRLDTTWEVVDLSRADLHFAIRYMGPPEPGIRARDLLPSGVVPVCTPDFARRYGLGPDTASLSGLPLVDIDVPTSDPDWVGWDGWCARTGVAPPEESARGPRFALTGSGLRLALSGIGLVLGGLSETFARVADGSLVTPFGPRSVVPGRYRHRLIWQADRRLGPVQRAVRDWISERAAADRVLIERLFGL
jgi:DNA-binding transcriptional LysR family regulator